MCLPLQNASMSEFERTYAGVNTLSSICTLYKPIHGYLASVICVLGILANMINIIVLTRKQMISSTNYILSAMALSDGITMMAYLPFALYFYVNGAFNDAPKQTVLSAHFLLFYVYCSVVVHSVSIWLTVVLAIFRYLFIKYPSKGQELCSISRARIAIIAICLSTLVICIPLYISHNVVEVPYTDRNGTSRVLWTVGPRGSQAETMNEQEMWALIGKINFWFNSILIKCLPCVLLTVMSMLLIRFMQEADQRRNNLRNMNSRGKPKAKEEDDSSRDRKTNRTTRMLVAVVVLFLICELPQGILGLLVGVLGQDFQLQVYDNLGDLLDVIALFNNSINFLIYCTMSKQFRTTFVQLFLTPLKRSRVGRGRFMLVQNENNHTTAINTKSTDV